MAEVVTTATAPANPTPPGPLTTGVPAAAPAAPRDGWISDHQYAALDASEQGKYARVRQQGPQGGSEWIARDKLPAEPTDTAKPAANGAATVTADGRLQVGDMLLSPQDIQTLMSEKAQADLRKTQIPTAPENYEAKLPEGFKLPEGLKFEFDANNPALADARRWAHANGLTQKQFGELLSFHASTQVAEQQLGDAQK
jgi:hypothetical protein